MNWKEIGFQAEGKYQVLRVKGSSVTRQISVENHLLNLEIMRSLMIFAIGVSMMCNR